VCPLCHWRGHSGDHRHPITDCEQAEAKEISKLSHSMQKTIQDKKLFAPFSCCMWCGVPQAICEHWQQKEEQGWWEAVKGGECQYADVLVPTLTTLMIMGADGDEVVFQEMKDEGIDIQDEVAVCRWLGQQVKWGGIEATKMVKVFHFLARLYRKSVMIDDI